MKTKSTFRRKNNIILRIVKDLLVGLIVSTILCILLVMLHEGIGEKWPHIGSVDIASINNQELFFTELSLVFLVISFVTLLANRTETVYWVDVIQYRLIKPNHSSIVDISSYIFANLIISLFAFLFPFASKLALFSFVLTIILLGFLSIKLLMAFFGIDALKEELEAEYRKALDFRKTVCELYYYDDIIVSSNYQLRKVRLGVQIRLKDAWYNMKCFFRKAYAPHQLPYQLEDYGSAAPIEQKDGNIDSVYEKLMKQNLWKGSKQILSKGALILKYIKVKYVYSKKFEGNINACLDMRDNLYANTIKCIEERRISESSEQIQFLFRYREYEHALSCMKLAIEKCPIAFLHVFDDYLAWDMNTLMYGYRPCANMLNQQIVELKKHPEYPILKNNKGLENAYHVLAWISQCDETMLQRQFQHAMQEEDAVGASFIYDRINGCVGSMFVLISGLTREFLNVKDGSKAFPMLKEKLEDMSFRKEFNAALGQRANECIARKDGKDREALYALAFGENKFDVAYHMLKKYQMQLDEYIRKAESVPGAITLRIDRDVLNCIKLAEASTCDLGKVYRLLEQAFLEERMESDTFLEFMDLIASCYKMANDHGKHSYCAPLVEKYQREIVKPCYSVLSKKGMNIDDICKKSVRSYSPFWKDVAAEKSH